MPLVSVIVPVYNPGSDIDDCIASLLGQTLPREELELIFVDDGSTDATPARLDALAAEHAHVKVQHIPNSGWPGKPRNIGLDLARGDYVYFVDNDDWLEPDALERLHAMAVADRAEIVVGKVVGHGKGVPRSLFERNRHGAPFDP
ncbi:MAG: glycosyltransferase family 2 protein, partial [Solirubrobacteraceae bacterium]